MLARFRAGNDPQTNALLEEHAGAEIPGWDSTDPEIIV